MASVDFQYDSESFNAAISKYNTAVSDYKKLSDSLKKAVDGMQGGWNTSAGEAFFKNFNDDFTPVLEKHIKFLEYLVQCLEYAAVKYDQVVDKAQNLKYQ